MSNNNDDGSAVFVGWLLFAIIAALLSTTIKAPPSYHSPSYADHGDLPF